MLFHNDPLFYMYWGDRSSSFFKDALYSYSDHEIRSRSPFAVACKLMELNHLIILKQKHTKNGFSITRQEDIPLYPPYQNEGDYLITTLPHVGLGVSSADCLPIIIFDPCAPMVGVAHAGWAGTLLGVATEMLETIHKQGNTPKEKLHIFFGPSAKACCYTIREELASQFAAHSCGEQALREHPNEKELFFIDLPLFNALQLKQAGASESSFHFQYNLCTICNPFFCSHRRDGVLAKRQITIASLRHYKAV